MPAWSGLLGKAIMLALWTMLTKRASPAMKKNIIGEVSDNVHTYLKLRKFFRALEKRIFLKKNITGIIHKTCIKTEVSLDLKGI